MYFIKPLLTRLDVPLRLLMGLLLVGSVIASGYQGRPAWIILNFSLVFALLYFIGKQGAYAVLLSRGASGMAKLVVPTLLIQGILCSLLYFIGRGIGSLSGVPYDAVIAPYDFLLPAGVAIVCSALTLLLSRVRRDIPVEKAETIVPTTVVPTVYSTETSGYTMLFDEAPVTPDNFFTGLYYRDEKTAALNNTTPEMIAQAEARLGITFPPLLRSLYMRQNGGFVFDLWVAAVENPTLDYKDWRGVFSHDYCYLTPLEKLRTLHDSYLDFLSEEEIAEDALLQKDAKRYVILCQRYMDTTFLDYSQSNDNPRVGIVDFDSTKKKAVWFNSFDEFFAALKRGELN